METTMSGHDFKWRRHRLGLKQQELADQMQVTRQWVGLLEKREVVPPVYALALMALEAQRGLPLNAAA